MRLALFLAVPFLVVGCTKETPPPAPAAPLPFVAPAPGPSNAPAGVVKGKVLETMDAASYTYLKLQTAEGETWAAVPQAKAEVGTEVTILNPMTMNGFESKTLGRKFDHILFGNLGTAEQAAAALPPPGGIPPPGMPAPSAAPPMDLGSIKVAKAEGKDARTVAEVFGQKATLKDASVSVRGKVVKFTAGVMSRNWVHLRDGSGSEATHDSDLTVTTQDTAAVGEEVLVKGTVHLDKDFGAGYAYPVIIEDAKLTK